MAPDFLTILFMLSIPAIFGKYVYITNNVDWSSAQSRCRFDHTDLAPISSEYDTSLLQKSIGGTNDWIWFGLTRNSSKPSQWIWSGGAEVTTFFWGPQQPDNPEGPGYGLLINYKWHDAPSNYRYTNYVCYKVHVVWEKRTWEEALAYCRKFHADLASVASKTEMMLMKNEMGKQGNITEHVWTGLRYLAGEWMWIDKQPLVYEAWGPGGKPECPAVFCGALQLTGTKEQSTSSVPAPVNDITNSLQNIVVNIEDVKEWNARSCDEKLHFLCY